MTRPGAIAAAAATVIALAGCGAAADGAAAPSGSPTTIATPASVAAPATTGATTTTTTEPLRPRVTAAPETTTAPTPPTGPPINTYSAQVDVLAPQAVAAPTAVLMPRIDIAGYVAPTGVDAAGELAIPGDAKTLVWYQHGPSPGQPGSAVIAGHLNWKGVTGTFSELDQTAVGELVTVLYDDGSQRNFSVREVELVDKPAVSVDGTFARDGESVLRLVTCGGEFDYSTRHYKSNVIVTAVPV